MRRVRVGQRFLRLVKGAGCGAVSILIASNASAQFNLLYSFAGGSGDGSAPMGIVTVSGSTFYGMTQKGGSDNYGTVFSMNTDGTGFSLLHAFSGVSGDGNQPFGSLTLSGSTLYGMTAAGGSHSTGGTVFSINTDGTGYSTLHSFSAGYSDGWSPHGSLAMSGSTLYGMADVGGSHGDGIVFSINADGTGYTILHNFSGGSGDGKWPSGSLTLIGSTLYGLTGTGGSSSKGTVFSMNIDGTGFRLLHTFNGGSGDGASPDDSLTLVGSTLYGMTVSGGSANKGTVFSINTDGTGFDLVHSFSADEGFDSHGSLTLIGSTLYGMATLGGSGDNSTGTVFSVNTDGTGLPSTAARTTGPIPTAR